MILKVSRLGHPVLRNPCEPVPVKEITAEPIQRLIDDMIETMREYDGVGLAANQVHVSQQIVVIEVERNVRYPQAPAIPLTVLINPRMVANANKQLKDWEGCLSVEGFRGEVPRWDWVEVEAYERTGAPVTLRAEGFFARVIQHECDHLAGKVYLDRMPDLRSLSHLQEYVRYRQEA
ncbi:MAG: peptide deformylase [Candidatus Omnitrophica bacterium]|nr:peptide deformylase [Candidatus Omnitrophota bacterium]